MDKNYTFTKEESKEKETKLFVKITPEFFVKTKDSIYHKLSQDVTITGFRPGKAPRNLIEARISHELYDETINKILPEITYEIISINKLSPLNQVEYEVKKMSDADGLEYEAKFVNTPTFKLCDFKKIKIKKEAVNVGDNDVQLEINRLLKMYNTREKKDIKSDEFSDEIVKQMKLGFESKEMLVDQIKKELEYSKSVEQEQKYISEIIKEAVKLSRIEVPLALVKKDTHRREHDYMDQVEKLGLKLDEFLKTQNKTLEDLNKEWDIESRQRVAEELLLLQVIKENGISVSKEEIEHEIAQITDEAMKGQMRSEAGTRYISTIILQQKAINYIKSRVNE